MDDSFVTGILERARERQRKLNKEGVVLKDIPNSLASKSPQKSGKEGTSINILKKHELSSVESNSESIVKFPPQNSITKISSQLPGSPRSQLKTLNIENENFNMEIKLSSHEDVTLQVQIEECNDSSNYDKNKIHEENKNILDGPALRENVKKRLQKLGKLFAGGDELDISSPIHRTEDNFPLENAYENKENKINSRRPCKGLGRLAALAQDINQWEDDITPRKHISEKNVSPKKIPVSKPLTSTQSSPVTRNLIVEKVVIDDKKDKDSRICSNLNDNNNDLSENSSEENSKSNSAKLTPKTTPQNLEWDQAVLKTLEQKEVKSITCNSEKLIDLKKVENEVTPRSPKKVAPYKSVSVANKAAIFESSPKNGKDPALLSVSERKALFEKNKGIAPVPKALPTNFKATVNEREKIKSKQCSNLAVGLENNDVKQEQINFEINSNLEKGKSDNKLKNKKVIDNNATTIENKETEKVSPSRKDLGASEGIAKKMAALLENKTTISQQQIENQIREQRQKEMDILLNRFQKNKQQNEDQIIKSESECEEEITEKTEVIENKKSSEAVKRLDSPPPPLPPPFSPPVSSPKKKSVSKRFSTEDSPKVAAVLDDIKRIKVMPPKEGHLYPCLSDIETATETETEQRTASPSPNSSFEKQDIESDVGANTSFEREILQEVCKNQVPQKRQIFDESTESDISDILNDMDDEYIDEAMAYNKGPTPPKHRRSSSPECNLAQPSNSFNYKSFSPRTNIQEKNSPKKENLSPDKSVPTHVVDGDDVLPLTHTISFYRKQQSQAVVTPIRQIIRQPSLEEQPEAEVLEDGVDKKIQDLLNEVSKQQTVISQTSQALNLCYSTPEFTGSTEQVEAEKVLLLATHRRQAALHEIQRLKVEGTLRPKTTRSQDFHIERGTLTISNIVLPLKREYARALAAAGGKGHHVICLVKCDEQVISTKLMSTVASSLKNLELELSIPGTVVLENVRGDFTLTFEVYCLQAQEEILPHEVKYHINNKKQGNLKITPKKCKSDNRMIKPPKESPAGPQAVRSPTFALMGYVVLSIQAINKKSWTLNKAPSMSPLEGSIHMNVSFKPEITVKHKGFLTMFEYVSGFGAWHRRWCLLEKGALVYWKYPDDEKKKDPINSINLNKCVTEKVGPVSREICARLNTFLIEIERDAYPQDKESLVTIRKGDKTIVRQLLSADTKEERIQWCDAFNKALASIRLTKSGKVIN